MVNEFLSPIFIYQIEARRALTLPMLPMGYFKARLVWMWDEKEIASQAGTRKKKEKAFEPPIYGESIGGREKIPLPQDVKMLTFAECRDVRFEEVS